MIFLNFIDFVVDVVSKYAEEFNLDEKEVFRLFSREGIFEYITDEFTQLQKSKDVIGDIIRYREINKKD